MDVSPPYFFMGISSLEKSSPKIDTASSSLINYGWVNLIFIKGIPTLELSFYTEKPLIL